MRPIDADAFITDTIKNKRFVFHTRDIVNDAFIAETVYGDLLAAVNNMPTIDVMPAWVSAADRLPDDGKEVLCWYRNTDGGRAVVCGRYSLRISPHWETDIDNNEEYIPVEEVTHWMPLPKPPKE